MTDPQPIKSTRVTINPESNGGEALTVRVVYNRVTGYEEVLITSHCYGAHRMAFTLGVSAKQFIEALEKAKGEVDLVISELDKLKAKSG